MTTPRPAPIIQTQDLTKYYGSHLAVDGISFSVNRGEIVGLLGPNGAGKSTTIRMVTGYLRPSSGTIRIAGHDLQEEPLGDPWLNVTLEGKETYTLSLYPEQANVYPARSSGSDFDFNMFLFQASLISAPFGFE